MLVNFNWRDAEVEYQRASDLAPNEAEAKLGVGQLRATFGNLDSAIDFTRQAMKIDPLQAYGYAWLADYFTGAYRLDEADQAIRAALELQPGASFRYSRLSTIEVLRGHADAALAAAKREPAGIWQDAAVAVALQVGADRNAADAALHQLIKAHADKAAFQIAQVYALRNDDKGVFVWLDRAWSNREPDLSFLLYDPFLRKYAIDSRFAIFCRKVGLPFEPALRKP
jgi:tetratricopeptide (TPR) repeat protein